MLNCYWIFINENERANFVHGFINYNMKVKYRLSTNYDQKKEIFLKTYNGVFLINKYGLLCAVLANKASSMTLNETDSTIKKR